MGDRAIIIDRIKSAVEACSMELYGVEHANNTLHIYIDHKESPITISNCEAVMKQLSYSENLDNMHVEVSSKGVYPPLLETKHYINSIGKWAKLKTRSKSYIGKIISATDEAIELSNGEETTTIPTASINNGKITPQPEGE